MKYLIIKLWSLLRRLMANLKPVKSAPLMIPLTDDEAAAVGRIVTQRERLDLALRAQLDLLYAQKKLSGPWALSEDGTCLLRVNQQEADNNANRSAVEAPTKAPSEG